MKLVVLLDEEDENEGIDDLARCHISNLAYPFYYGHNRYFVFRCLRRNVPKCLVREETFITATWVSGRTSVQKGRNKSNSSCFLDGQFVVEEEICLFFAGRC